MGEMDCEESWVLKNWCFWTVVLEKPLESPLDSREIQPVHPKDQSWVFIGRTDAEAETAILWPSHAKSWLIRKDSDARKDWGQEKRRTTEGEMAWWYHRLDGHEFYTRGWQSLGASLNGCWNSRCACQLDSSTPGGSYGGGHSFPPDGPGSCWPGPTWGWWLPVLLFGWNCHPCLPCGHPQAHPVPRGLQIQRAPTRARLLWP